ncbi:MAG: phosphoglycerate kinase [Candidatus Levyibacteriota bacterium]
MPELKNIGAVPSFENKKALVRVDTDVDLQGEVISDDTRLASSLETVRYILDHQGTVVILGHLGRPDGKENPEFTLLPIAKWYAQKFNGVTEETKLGDFNGWKITDHMFVVENLRFFPEEEEKGEEFVKKLAALGDVYVNEAFAVSHRDHASISGIPTILPSYAGFHLQEETATLSKILENPERPLVVVIGGAKIETKLPMVETMHKIADYVLVGGQIAEQDKILMGVQEEKQGDHKCVVLVADNTEDGLDITPKDTENFIQIFMLAKTIVWNGPVGKMGNPETEANTLKIAEAIANSGAYTVVGGGDSLTLLKQHNMLDRFSFVSTGGGAMLEFLSGKDLPGIKVLEQ